MIFGRTVRRLTLSRTFFACASRSACVIKPLLLDTRVESTEVSNRPIIRPRSVTKPQPFGGSTIGVVTDAEVGRNAWIFEANIKRVTRKIYGFSVNQYLTIGGCSRQIEFNVVDRQATGSAESTVSHRIVIGKSTELRSFETPFVADAVPGAVTVDAKATGIFSAERNVWGIRVVVSDGVSRKPSAELNSRSLCS